MKIPGHPFGPVVLVPMCDDPHQMTTRLAVSSLLGGVKRS